MGFYQRGQDHTIRIGENTFVHIFGTAERFATKQYHVDATVGRGNIFRNVFVATSRVEVAVRVEALKKIVRYILNC